MTIPTMNLQEAIWEVEMAVIDKIRLTKAKTHYSFSQAEQATVNRLTEALAVIKDSAEPKKDLSKMTLEELQYEEIRVGEEIESIANNDDFDDDDANIRINKLREDQKKINAVFEEKFDY